MEIRTGCYFSNVLVEEARELLFLRVFFHGCGDYIFGQFLFDMLPFKRKLLRIWQCLWLTVFWQWCSSEVAASRKITIQTWQKLADIFVRVKHRAQRQIYQKNRYHELLGCHCLLIMAARATLSPELLSWSCTGTWHYPEGEIFTGYNSQQILLLAGQGTFCSQKEQRAELSAALPFTGPPRKWVVDEKSLYFGRQTWSPGQDQSSGEVFFVIPICFLHFWFLQYSYCCVCRFVPTCGMGKCLLSHQNGSAALGVLVLHQAQRNQRGKCCFPKSFV